MCWRIIMQKVGKKRLAIVLTLALVLGAIQIAVPQSGKIAKAADILVDSDVNHWDLLPLQIQLLLAGYLFLTRTGLKGFIDNSLHRTGHRRPPVFRMHPFYVLLPPSQCFLHAITQDIYLHLRTIELLEIVQHLREGDGCCSIVRRWEGGDGKFVGHRIGD